MIISTTAKDKVFHDEHCRYVQRINKKRQKNVDPTLAMSKGYRPCKWCGGMHGTFLRITNDPYVGGKKARDGMTVSYDGVDQAICFRTGIGFWKVLQKNDGFFRLWHLNGSDFEKDKTDKELMRGSFHRQSDVKETVHIGRLIVYVSQHDKAKPIIEEDWRKLPKTTQKQKRYYKQAKNRERKKQHRRIDELFKQLEKGEL